MQAAPRRKEITNQNRGRFTDSKVEEAQAASDTVIPAMALNEGARSIMEIVLVLLYGAIVYLTVRLAKQRGRSPIVWGFSALFFHLLALIAVVIMGEKTANQSNGTTNGSEEKAPPKTSTGVEPPTRGKAKKLFEQAQKHIDAGEEVLSWAQGAYETQLWGNDTVRRGILIATNRKVLFYASKMTGDESEALPLSNISSVESGRSMLGAYIRLYTSGNEARMKWIQEGHPEHFVKTLRARIGKDLEQAQENESDVGKPDVIGQIERLAKLRDEGVLSDEEFQSKKAELLERM